MDFTKSNLFSTQSLYLPFNFVFMKNLLIAAFLSLFIFSACNNKQVKTTKVINNTDKELIFYGATFEPAKKTLNITDLHKKMESTALLNTTVKGEVEKVCMKKGCWMTIKNSEGDPMRVTFKDYAFFMPMDIHDKKVTFTGKAYQDTTSVDMLRHYAEDEGLAQSEINKITEPKIEIAFEATGVYFD